MLVTMLRFVASYCHLEINVRYIDLFFFSVNVGLKVSVSNIT